MGLKASSYWLKWVKRNSRVCWWHCPPDTGFLEEWGRARYLSVTEIPHNINSLQVRGEETFHFFETWKPERGLNDHRQSKQAAFTGPRPMNQPNNPCGYHNVASCFARSRWCQHLPCDTLKTHLNMFENNAGLVLAQRRRQWSNITPTLVQCVRR